MLSRSEDEIKAEIERLWPTQPDNLEVSISDNLVTLRFESMYEAPELSFSQLFALSEFFGTKNVNDDDRFGSSGCETCDYGSSYGFTLSIRPEQE